MSDQRAGARGIYDGFMSYSHAADGLLAPRLQAGLQRFAKPWWRRRAVRIFRDESSLSANPHLWSSITDALDTSGWFVLLLSPDAAHSEWVNQEVAYWVANRDPSRILPVVTAGQFGWSNGDVQGDAVPDALRGVFAEEPRWVDVRWARGEEHLDLKDPRFADAVADIGSAIRGVPKDELASEEVRQHRRTVRTAWAAGGLVAVLAVAAVGFGISSAANAREAERQAALAAEQASLAEANAEAEARARQEADANAERAQANAEAEAEARAEADDNARLARARELASAAVVASESDSQLALLLVNEAVDLLPAGVEVGPAIESAIRTAISSDRLLNRNEALATESPSYMDISPDGSRLAVSVAYAKTLQVLDAGTLTPLWEYTLDTQDFFGGVGFSSEGSYVYMAIEDAAYSFGRQALDGEPEGEPNARMMVFDAADGTVLHVEELPGSCAANAIAGAWREDLGLFGFGFVGCGDEGEFQGTHRIVRADGWETVYERPARDYPNVTFGGSGTVAALLSGFNSEPSSVLLDTETWQVLHEVQHPWGALSPDGTLFAGSTYDNAFWGIELVDVASGRVLDRLPMGSQFPWYPQFAPEGDLLAVASGGDTTFVFDVRTGELVEELVAGETERAAFDGETIYTLWDGVIQAWDALGGSEGDFGVVPLNLWVNGNAIYWSGDTVVALVGDRGTGEWWFYPVDPGDGSLGNPIPADDFWNFAPIEGNRVVAFRGREQEPGVLERGTLEVVDLETGATTVLGGCWMEEAEAFRHEACPNGEPHPGGTILSSGSADGTEFAIIDVVAPEDLPAETFLTIWDAETLTVKQTLSLGVLEGSNFRHSILTHDAVVLLDFRRSEITVVNRKTGARTPVDLGGLEPARLERDRSRNRVWMELNGGRVAWLDLNDLSVHRVSETIPGRIRGLAASPSGDRIAVGSTDDVLRIFSEDGELLHEVPITSPSDAWWLDDQHLVVGTANGPWAGITLDPNELIDVANGRIRRGFTPQECEYYDLACDGGTS